VLLELVYFARRYVIIIVNLFLSRCCIVPRVLVKMFHAAACAPQPRKPGWSSATSERVVKQSC